MEVLQNSTGYGKIAPRPATPRQVKSRQPSQTGNITASGSALAV